MIEKQDFKKINIGHMTSKKGYFGQKMVKTGQNRPKIFVLVILDHLHLCEKFRPFWPRSLVFGFEPITSLELVQRSHQKRQITANTTKNNRKPPKTSVFVLLDASRRQTHKIWT